MHLFTAFTTLLQRHIFWDTWWQLFLGNVPGGNIFEVGWRQIFQLDEVAELTFTI